MIQPIKPFFETGSRRITLDRDKNDKKRIYGSVVFGSISSEMSEIIPLHCDCIHYNPVRPELCAEAEDWQFPSIHRFIAQRQYPPDLGVPEIPEKPQDIWDE